MRVPRRESSLICKSSALLARQIMRSELKNHLERFFCPNVELPKQGYLFRQMGGLPPQPSPRPSKQRSHKRLIWFLVCGLACLSVVLGCSATGSARKSQQQNGSMFTSSSYDSVNSRLFSKSSPW